MDVVIVDDEKQIREGIQILLSRIDDMNLIGEAQTVEEAIPLINKNKPDLVLLDIQLKDKTGFRLLDKLSYLDFHLIFITAYNEYAVKAFKYNAFDYLLKPIDPDEFKESIDRLRNNQFKTKQQLSALNQNSELSKLVINTSSEVFILEIDKIIRCEADKGYTFFYVEDKKPILSSKTLKEYNELLPSESYIRVHQSHLVNKHFIDYYDKKGFLVLTNGDKVPVSVRNRSRVMKSI